MRHNETAAAGSATPRRADPADWRSACRKGEGRPSFLRTPTVSTPQCTKTARRMGRRAAPAAGPTRGSCDGIAMHGREEADGSHGVPDDRLSGVRPAQRIHHGIARKKRPGTAPAAAATDASSPGTLAISALGSTPWRSSSAAQSAPVRRDRRAAAASPAWRPLPRSDLACSHSQGSKKRREKKCTCASATAQLTPGCLHRACSSA